MEVGAALADDDLAGLDELAAEALDAEALRVGVAAVTGGTKPLLVCHDEGFFLLERMRSGCPLYWLTPERSLDGGDLDGRQLSAVALALAEAGLVLELEDVDLRTLLVADDFGANGYLG